jgi:hypothetical protein
MIKFQITGYDPYNFAFTVNYAAADTVVNGVVFDLLQECLGVTDVEEIKRRIAQRGIEEIRKVEFTQTMQALIGQDHAYPIHEVENLPSLHVADLVQLQEVV